MFIALILRAQFLFDKNVIFDGQNVCKDAQNKIANVNKYLKSNGINKTKPNIIKAYNENAVFGGVIVHTVLINVGD